MSKFTYIPSLAILMLVVGCTVHPAGEKEERNSAIQAGRALEQPIEQRTITPLPENAGPDQIVQFAMLNNAELEQRYWEWRAAIEQIPQDGTQSTTLNLSTGTTITKGRTGWGSSTVSLDNDPMTDIKWPGKLDAAARQTLDNARAAGHRFIKAKYDLRNKVLSAYYDYALNAELIRLGQTNQQLLQTTALATESANRAGSASQQDVLKAQNEVDMSANDIASMQSQLASQRAAINALLSRVPDAALPAPTELPAARPVAFQDQQLLVLAARQNPELIAQADELRARDQGIRLAKLQYVPDFNLSAGTDLMGITQSLRQVTIPAFRYEAIDAAIAQAKANLRATQAIRRQTASDLATQTVTDIAIIRDADRELQLLQTTILPRARQAVIVGRAAYESGHSSLIDLLDSQRAEINIERLIATLKIDREKHVVDLEAITASDLSIPQQND